MVWFHTKNLILVYSRRANSSCTISVHACRHIRHITIRVHIIHIHKACEARGREIDSTSFVLLGLSPFERHTFSFLFIACGGICMNKEIN